MTRNSRWNRRWRALALQAIVAGLLSCIARGASSSEGPGIGGSWIAPLKSLAGAPIRLAVSIDPAAGEAERRVVVDSPDQGFWSLALTEVQLTEDSLAFSVPTLGARFSGRWESAKDELSGSLELSTGRLPLVFLRGRQGDLPPRPVPSSPPQLYQEREVEFAGGAGRLTGTLTVPRGDGPHPAALLLGVAFPDDRNGTLGRHQFYRTLADALTRAGLAVLRFDDRGVGGSAGQYFEATYSDLVQDAAAGMRFLAAQNGIDAKRAGLIGWSEGSAVASLLAAQESEATSFLVLLGGLGLPAATALPEQAAALAQARGASLESVDKARSQAREWVEIAAQVDETRGALRTQLEARLASGELDPSRLGLALPRSAIVEVLTSPWYRSQFSYQPSETLSRSTCPLLALTGGLDRVLPSARHLPAILRSSLEAGPSRDVSVRQLPGLNHLLQPAKTGLPDEYASIATTLAPVAVEALIGWLRDRGIAPIPSHSP